MRPNPDLAVFLNRDHKLTGIRRIVSQGVSRVRVQTVFFAERSDKQKENKREEHGIELWRLNQHRTPRAAC